MRSLRFRIALTYTGLVLVAIAAAALLSSHTAGTAASPRGVVAGVALVAIASTAAAVLLASWLAGPITHPIAKLDVAVRALAAGSPPSRLPRGGGAEIERLTSAFDEMASSLYETMRTREQVHSRFEALLASSGDGLVALDADGIVRFQNRAALDLFGDSSGRALAEVARSPELTALLRASLSQRPVRSTITEAEEPEQSRTALIYLDRRDLWLQATVSGIAGGGGWSLLVILHDVTEIRRAETTRRDFVANVSHELRTPLAGIKAMVETLRDGALDDRAAADEFLVQVDGEVDRLVQLVEELLQLARIESGAVVQMSPVDPVAVLEDCVTRFRPQAERAGVTLRLAPADSLPAISANAAQLGQAVGNLVHNAIKFTPAGGSVVLSAEPEGRELRISVADTGSGIDSADLPRVFERFYVADRSRAGRGTGLGLAIVKHVVRAHGGKVEAQSEPGVGSTFTIALPVS